MNVKLSKFIKRNKWHNAHLYQPDLLEGQDYIVCPASGAKLIVIRSDYITKVLGMTLEEYHQKYPGTQTCCQTRKDNIKRGMKAIDPQTGLTKSRLGQIKAKQTLSEVDEHGVSGYKKKGEKTRATHMNKLDNMGRNGYSQLAAKAIIKGNQTKAKKGLITPVEDRTEFRRYKLIVLYLTDQHRKNLSAGYITGLAGTENAWHLDHMFSILRGYQQKISPFVIGHVKNLKMLPWQENVSKHAKCSISIETLFSETGYTHQQSLTEYAKILDLINNDIINNVPPTASYLLERYYESTIRT